MMRMKPEELSKHINGKINLVGTHNTCEATADWVADVLRGTNAKGLDVKKDQKYAGSAIKDLFVEKAQDKTRHHVFQLYLKSGIGASHSWIVYQFPNPKTPNDAPLYQVFQSFLGAYTLKAWLTPATTDARKLAERNKYITQNWLTKCGKSKGAAPGCGNEAATYDRMVEQLTIELPQLKEQNFIAMAQSWQDALDQLQGKNPNQPVESFELAWKLYGGGKTLTAAEMFDGQTTFVSRIMDILKWSNDGAQKPITAEDLKQYEEVFGARIEATFPGLPKDKFHTWVESILFIKVDPLTETKPKNVNAACVKEGKRVGGKLVS